MHNGGCRYSSDMTDFRYRHNYHRYVRLLS